MSSNSNLHLNDKLNLFFSSFILLSIPIFFIVGTFFANLIVIITTIYLIIFEKKYFLKLNKKIYYSIFLILFFFLINSFFSNDKITTFFKSISYLRFFLFCLGIFLILSSTNKNLRNNLFTISILIIFFVIFDTVLQFVSGKDIFGFESDDNYLRLSGPFGDELIVGFFILYYGSICLFYSLRIEIKNKKILFFILLYFIGITVFLTGERASCLSFFLFLFILFLLSKNQRISLFISFLLIALSIVVILFNSERMSKKYSFLQVIQNHTLEYSEKNIQIEKITSNQKKQNPESYEKSFISESILKYYKMVINSYWVAHYRGGIQVFKNNLFFGSGFKTFRSECFNYKNNENIICTLHPHNIYIELLSDTGIIGFLIFFSFISFIFYKFYERKCYLNFDSIVIFSIFLTFLFPFKPHGSLFSTNYAFIFFLITSHLIYLINNNEEK